MRIANLAGRLVIVDPTPKGPTSIDVERASSGHFSSDPHSIYDRWDEFRRWAATAELPAGQPFPPEELLAPSPRPRQVLAIGLNYREHAAETGHAVPDAPLLMFTKWPTCLTGPVTTVELPAEGNTDWEVEVVVVIGRTARHITAEDVWGHVAGLTVGQDLSERITQMSGPLPQFSLGKSLAGFGPTGPWLVTPEEFTDPDDLEFGCSVNGEEVQKGRTSELIFSIPQIVAALSQRMTLLPGDVLFTGTPSGVGIGRKPPRFLSPGDELVSYVEGIGELRQSFTA
ncbi:fumarylacetoacetate hydrolase family protein [Streptomyces muensis]|uniref:Fumarylacetoacetate hydrolase family protein n=1 Tax=Streptomyces muensis TaxID=1077944 RepID=A0A9X1PT09_STRM4|nr:fumarylacetoacetate hydrolase family protein [Streptomyces muensis]MCF1592568.1 fumarylacetoacetate hydrolase family protein [Streptomyces muensis]